MSWRSQTLGPHIQFILSDNSRAVNTEEVCQQRGFDVKEKGPCLPHRSELGYWVSGTKVELEVG